MNLNKIKKYKNYNLLIQSSNSFNSNREKFNPPKNILISFIKKIILLAWFLYLINNNFNKYDYNKSSIFYENNIDFSNYSTDIKAIAIYLPNYTFFYSNKNYNPMILLKNVTPKYKGHHQPRILHKNYINNNNLRLLIKKQIKLAKSHGIFGFAIYYYWFSGKNMFDKPLTKIYKNKQNFHYMLIWKNEKVINKCNETIFDENCEDNDSEKFIKDIKRYLIDKLYIRTNGKPILGIYNVKAIPNLKKKILKIRQKAREFEIGEIFIISCLNGLNISEVKNMNIFDGAYKSPPNNLEGKIIKNTNENYTYYYSLFYSNIFNDSNIINFTVYKGNMLEYDNSPITKNNTIYGEYSPELFFKINKLLIKQLKIELEEANRFIFINAWNNYFEGAYLEPDERYGYGSINALSKSLFDIPFRNWNHNLSNLMNNCLVAVHAHIFYKHLLNELINKINNIPIKFDLYLSTDTIQKMEFIKNSTDIYSRANSVTIKIIENKGRDVLPFIIQIGEVMDKYKYLCHLHTKKTLNPYVGERWRNYLLNNLLGTTELISEILSDFENNEKLGFIFPENFYKILQYTMYVKPNVKVSMKYFFTKLLPEDEFPSGYFDFPGGDMFWARTKAIYQVFKIDLRNDIPEEKDSKDILYALERLWLFIVKKNGFYYKKYFNYK